MNAEQVKTIKAKDFIELDFVALTDDGRVFDTTITEEAVKAKLPEGDYKPIHVCVGEGNLVKGFDSALENKNVGEAFEITLQPEEAFGKRDSKLVKIIPLKTFLDKEVQPHPGLPVVIDDLLATVRAVSGGRVTTDFNHPLAGRKVVYRVTIKRLITDEKEKAETFVRNYFRTEKFEVKVKLAEKKPAGAMPEERGAGGAGGAAGAETAETTEAEASKEENTITLEGNFPEKMLREAEKRLFELLGKKFAIKKKV